MRSWFFSVVKNVAAEARRGGMRRRLLGLRLAAAAPGDREPDQAPAPERVVAADRSAAQLREALMLLPQRQREVMHLVFYAGCTLEETAEALAISIGSARTHYHRGKLRLSELLGLEHLHATDI